MRKWHLSRDLNQVSKQALLSGKSIPGRRNRECESPEVSTCLVVSRTVSRGGSVILAMGVKGREKEDEVSTGKWRPHESLADHAKDSVYLRWDGGWGEGGKALDNFENTHGTIRFISEKDLCVCVHSLIIYLTL